VQAVSEKLQDAIKNTNGAGAPLACAPAAPLTLAVLLLAPPLLLLLL
jgi:hypothetical protein